MLFISVLKSKKMWKQSAEERYFVMIFPTMEDNVEPYLYVEIKNSPKFVFNKKKWEK